MGRGESERRGVKKSEYEEYAGIRPLSRVNVGTLGKLLQGPSAKYTPLLGLCYTHPPNHSLAKIFIPPSPFLLVITRELVCE